MNIALPSAQRGGLLTQYLSWRYCMYVNSHAETAAWSSPVTLGALAAGTVLLAAFAVLQAKVASPLLPLRILADRTRAGAYLAIFTVGISIFGMLLFVTYYLQQNLRFSAIDAGLAFLPMTFALAIAAQLSIRKLLPKTGIHSDSYDQAIITLDQPSSAFAGLGNPQITEVGTELDHTVAELLQAITGRAPQVLLQPGPATREGNS